MREAADMLGTYDVVQRRSTFNAKARAAHRQMEVFDRTNDPKAIVDWLIEETMRGV